MQVVLSSVEIYGNFFEPAISAKWLNNSTMSYVKCTIDVFLLDEGCWCVEFWHHQHYLFISVVMFSCWLTQGSPFGHRHWVIQVASSCLEFHPRLKLRLLQCTVIRTPHKSGQSLLSQVCMDWRDSTVYMHTKFEWCKCSVKGYILFLMPD